MQGTTAFESAPSRNLGLHEVWKHCLGPHLTRKVWLLFSAGEIARSSPQLQYLLDSIMHNQMSGFILGEAIGGTKSLESDVHRTFCAEMQMRPVAGTGRHRFSQNETVSSLKGNRTPVSAVKGQRPSR